MTCACRAGGPALHAIIRRSMQEAQGRRHNKQRIRALGLVTCALCLVTCASCLVSACATVPLPVPEPPIVTWEEKLGWMMRLEDQRILRDPNPPPVVVLAPATQDRPAIVAPPPPSDL